MENRCSASSRGCASHLLHHDGRNVTVEELRALLESLATLPPMGEAVDQLAHALQTAGGALAAGADDELVLVTGSLYTVGEARTALRPRAGSVESPSHP